MFEVYKQYLGERATLTEEEFARLKAAYIPKIIKRRHFLLREGEVSQYYGFVARGCLRTYHLDKKGGEHTMRFSVETWWVGDGESLLTGKPSIYNIEALEDSHVLLWPRLEYEEIRNGIPALKEFSERLMSKNLIASQNRIHASITYSAEERYNDFLQKYPDLTQRVPLHMIASYLGISPVTLSRIRTQAAKNGQA